VLLEPFFTGRRPVKAMVKRRVSRVESLRNLLFNRNNVGGAGNKGFLLKKRARSAEKEKVDKSCGTDSDYLSEEDILAAFSVAGGRGGGSLCGGASSVVTANDDYDDEDRARHLYYDGDDTASQISAMDSASQAGGSMIAEGGSTRSRYRPPADPSLIPRSLSVGELPVSSATSSVVGGDSDKRPHVSRRGQFPYAYIRSRLSVLPEEQAGQLSRRESMNQGNEPNTKDGGVYRATRAIVQEETTEASSSTNADTEIADEKLAPGTSFRLRQKALRRKRSLSVPDIPVPPGFEDGGNRPRVIRRCEESGYDSDATRKSSPRGSLKSDMERVVAKLSSVAANAGQTKNGRERKTSEDTDSMSSKSDDSGNVSGGSKEEVSANAEDASKAVQPNKNRLPEGIKKPPRKSKLPEATFRQHPPSTGRFKKHNDVETDLAEVSGLPSLSNRRFKMLRLRRDPGEEGGDSNELGVVISKKRHPQKGTTGYVIAHIDEDGAVCR